MGDYRNVDLSINKLAFMKELKDYSKLTKDEEKYIENYFQEGGIETAELVCRLYNKLQDKLTSIITSQENVTNTIIRVQVLYLDGYKLLCFEDACVDGDVDLVKQFDKKLKTVDVGKFMLYEMKINTENTQKVLDTVPMDNECICFITTTETLPKDKTVDNFEIFDLEVNSEISWL